MASEPPTTQPRDLPDEAIAELARKILEPFAVAVATHSWMYGAYDKAFHLCVDALRSLPSPAMAPEAINTTVRCFRTKERGSKSYGIWAMTTETRGVFYHGDGYERAAPRWNVTDLENPAEDGEYFGCHSVAITPQDAIELLAYWPEAQKDLRAVFARHSVDQPATPAAEGEVERTAKCGGEIQIGRAHV